MVSASQIWRFAALSYHRKLKVFWFWIVGQTNHNVHLSPLYNIFSGLLLLYVLYVIVYNTYFYIHHCMRNIDYYRQLLAEIN